MDDTRQTKLEEAIREAISDNDASRLANLAWNVAAENSHILSDGLIFAAEIGSVDCACYLLQNIPDIDINATDERGDTPFIVAVESYHHVIASLLLSYGANVTKRNASGYSALDVACRSKQIPMVRLLLDEMLAHLPRPLRKNALQPSQELYLYNALCVAAECGNAEVVGLFIREGLDVNLNLDEDVDIDINATDERGDTPFIVAVESYHHVIASLLLSYGANVTKRNASGYSALDVACRSKQIPMVRLLLDEMLAHLPRPLRKNALQPSQELYLYNALCVAAECGNAEVVGVFIREGLDVNLNLDEDVGTALHCAIESGNLDCVNYLLNAGANNEAVRRCINQTPLMRACEFGHVTLVERLLDSGVDINRQTDGCSTALVISCHFGEVEVVDCLLRHGADPNIRNQWGFTALYMAIDTPSITARLVEENIDVNEKCGERGEAPLHLAAVIGNIESMKILLQRGANINIRTLYDETAIWLAAWKGHLNIAKLLIKNNCHLNVPSNGCQVYAWDYMPVEIALGAAHFNIAVLLLKANCKLVNSVYYKEENGPLEDVPWLKLRREVLEFLQNNDKTSFEWVIKHLRNPRTLKDFCRLQIRCSLHLPISKTVKYISLPQILQKYVDFEDL